MFKRQANRRQVYGLPVCVCVCVSVYHRHLGPKPLGLSLAANQSLWHLNSRVRWSFFKIQQPTLFSAIIVPIIQYPGLNFPPPTAKRCSQRSSFASSRRSRYLATAVPPALSSLAAPFWDISYLFHAFALWSWWGRTMNRCLTNVAQHTHTRCTLPAQVEDGAGLASHWTTGPVRTFLWAGSFRFWPHAKFLVTTKEFAVLSSHF